MPYLVYPATADGKTEDKQREVNELNSFIANQPNEYNGGMTLVAENHVMREAAKYFNCDFADSQLPNNLATALNEQRSSANDILLCTAMPIDKSNAEENLKNLITAIQGIKLSNKYKKTLIPIATSGYGVAHMMTLAIEGNNAYIFEQLGGQSYGEVKKDLGQALSNAGFTVKVNTQSLTERNRLDCATVSNKIIFEAMQADSLEELNNRVNQKSPYFSAADIDGQHRIDQQFARLALKDINAGHRDDRNNSADIILLQKLLNKCSGNLQARIQLTEDFWNADDKVKFVNEYQPSQDDNNLHVDDKVDDNSSPDNGWKDEVRKAVNEANQTVKTQFDEYEDTEHPERLCFRNGDDKMFFSSRNSVAVEGDIQTFRTLCQTAINLGHKAINFGKFEEHPEYKARLYLACLEKDLKMNNAPQLEELKEYPEYKDILKLYIPKKRQELGAALKKSAAEFNKANVEAEKDPEYNRLKNELKNAKRSKDKEAIEQAQAALEANESAQKVKKATAAYKNAMKASLNFYIEYGSESSKAEETPEQRRKKVEKHLTEYDAQTFFSTERLSKKDREEGKEPTPRTPKKEEIEKYAPSQRIAREIMGLSKSR